MILATIFLVLPLPLWPLLSLPLSSFLLLLLLIDHHRRHLPSSFAEPNHYCHLSLLLTSPTSSLLHFFSIYFSILLFVIRGQPTIFFSTSNATVTATTFFFFFSSASWKILNFLIVAIFSSLGFYNELSPKKFQIYRTKLDSYSSSEWTVVYVFSKMNCFNGGSVGTMVKLIFKAYNGGFERNRHCRLLLERVFVVVSRLAVKGFYRARHSTT